MRRSVLLGSPGETETMGNKTLSGSGELVCFYINNLCFSFGMSSLRHDSNFIINATVE